METIKQEWLNKLFKPKHINRKKMNQDIKWLYSFSKLKDPLVIILDSPLAIQIAANYFNNNQVKGQVGGQVGDQVRGQVGDQVWDQVGGQIKFYKWGYYGDIWDYGWMSFYNFFEKLGIVKNENYIKFKSLLNNDIFITIQLDGLCLVSRKPKHIYRDKNNNLHSNETCAIKFRDGFKLWYLSGVNFEYELWEKVINKTITGKEIFAIENMEQRMAAIKEYGAGNMTKELNAKFINKSERGNELYSVDSIFDTTQYFLKYSCPSTERIYTKFVDPKFAKNNLNADACQAWSLGIVPTDYNLLTKET